MGDYYVYVYIDPRNFEEFYYGKGKGSRKEAHQKSAHQPDHIETDKIRCIRDINKVGLQPIIRVIARGLTEQEAFLVEKTLLWKLGKWTTNISSGYFADKFRPNNTYHHELSGFDFHSAIWYYNVGESRHRNWDDYRKFGFISAGQGQRWRDAMLGFNEGDIFLAYLKRKKNVGGFVGIGKILRKARAINEVVVAGKPLLAHDLVCKNLADNCDDPIRSEYVSIVEWTAAVPRNEGKWRREPKLYTTPLVRASLDGQPETVKFVEDQFGVQIRELAI